MKIVQDFLKSNIVLFVLIVCTYFIANPFFISKMNTFIFRPETITTKMVSLIVFFSINILFIVFLYYLAKTKTLYKIYFLIFILIGNIIYITFYFSTSNLLTFFDFVVLRTSAANFEDAFFSYFQNILKSSLYLIPLLIIILIKRYTNKSYLKEIVFLFLLPIFLISGVIIYKKTGRGAEGLPPMIIPYSYELSYLGNNFLSKPFKQREAPDYDNKNSLQNIVLIIDESIRSDFINSTVTPEVKNLKNIINFGKATSYANCSQYSNILIRKLARYGKEVNDLRNNLNIWEVMKKANYENYLVDSQGNGRGHNFFTEKELEGINNINTKTFKDDIDSAKEINNILKSNNKKKFILLIKKGAHFPYVNENIELKFTPNMTSKMMAFNTKEQIINSYSNLIYHNTNLFFKEIQDKYDSTLFIYTSDHGQNLENLENRQTHCSVNEPEGTQGDVPFLLFGDINIDSLILENLKNIKVSHYLIPYILMSGAGYSNESIENLMGGGEIPSINEFLYGNVYGFFGGEGERKNIEE